MKIPLARPDISEREIDAVAEVLRSGILSIGPKIEEFEKEFASYIGVKHAIGVNSGTSGLHLLIKSFNIAEGDEVITTPFSFIASSNCILFERARPVFVDIDPLTLNMDIGQIESKVTEKTRAILAVDAFGQPVDIMALRKIAQKYGLKLIEDSCEAVGSEYDGIKAGSMADGSVFAFYPNKQMTTAEGGMIVTNDDEVANLCRSYRSQGRAVTGLWLEHERLGYNYRMSELHAALGLVQLERLDEFIRKRAVVAEKYNQKFKDVEGVRVPYIDKKVTRMSWFVYVIQLDHHIDRNRVMKHLLDSGIGCRPYFTPIHLQPFYREMFGYKPGDFPVTERVASSTISLPFHNNLSDEEINYVVEKVREGIEKFGG
ncbi:DegT/DnrJ/EryC1/StrS family aminotransferase [Thermoanaerobacterium sp. DL9XJH110]|uniref:DegT/DnrJ/EryC1/StrS family aminotransferase n=1 Tax=Thermoanaerobacterium sp. DL9XJH110 TaxID=3386643 RepID=UPI003BB71EF3